MALGTLDVKFTKLAFLLLQLDQLQITTNEILLFILFWLQDELRFIVNTQRKWKLSVTLSTTYSGHIAGGIDEGKDVKWETLNLQGSSKCNLFLMSLMKLSETLVSPFDQTLNEKECPHEGFVGGHFWRDNVQRTGPYTQRIGR
jgi:hypothetical protein